MADITQKVLKKYTGKWVALRGVPKYYRAGMPLNGKVVRLNFSHFDKEYSIIFGFGAGIIEIAEPRGEVTDDGVFGLNLGRKSIRYHFSDFGTSSFPGKDGRSLYQKMNEALSDKPEERTAERTDS